MTDKTDYRADVQALRGIAVLLVVVFHAWPQLLSGGYVGVDVFFVISGYLITRLLLRETELTGRVDLGAFYARRIRRLLPAAALVTATTVVVFSLATSSLDVQEVTSSAIATALYSSNIWFAALSVDYLQEDLQLNPLLHTWSLGVEEQFYLVWPALILLSVRLLPHVSRRAAVAWMVAAITLLSLLAGVYTTFAVQSWAFFSLPTRAWELGMGAAAMLLERRVQGLGPSTRGSLALAGLVCIVTAALLFSAETRFPGYAALLPVVGAFLVIVVGASQGAGAFAMLRPAPLQRLGDLSYSWYLWHWPVLILVADLWPAADRNLVAAGGVAVSLGLARMTFEFVENPVRRHPALQERPRRAFALALMLTAGTLGVVVLAGLAAGRVSDADQRGRMEAAARDWPRLYEDKCYAGALDIEPPRCSYGAAEGAHTIALVGDSHAAQWFPALESLALSHGLRLVVFVKAGCPLAAVEPFDPKLKRPYVECTQWRETVFRQLAELRPTLVVGSSSSFYEALVTRDQAAHQRWRDGLEESLDRLAAAAEHVVVIADTPRPGFHVPRCLARAYGDGLNPSAACHYFLSESVLPTAIDLERAAVNERPRVSLVDMNPAICADVMCPVERDGIVLFHDAEHVSATLARILAQGLWERLPETLRDGLKD